MTSSFMTIRLLSIFWVCLLVIDRRLPPRAVSEDEQRTVVDIETG